MGYRWGLLATIVALVATAVPAPLAAFEVEFAEPRIAYTYAEPVVTEDGHAWFQGIATVGLDGSDQQVLTRPDTYFDYDAQPDWSPDGRLIAFGSLFSSTREYLVRVIPRHGGEPMVVDHGYNPAWSPDGRHLAYAVHDDGDDSFALAITPVDTSGDEPVFDLERRTLVKMPRRVLFPSWSPNGDAVAFLMDKDREGQRTGHGKWELYRFDLDTREPVSLSAALDIVSNGSAPTWSPFGDTIAVLAASDRDRPDYWHPWLVASDGSGTRRLGAQNASEYYFSVQWAPHGLFLVAKPAWHAIARYLLPDGTIARDVDVGVTVDSWIGFTPDASRLLLAGEDDEWDPWDPDLFSVALDGSDRRKLTQGHYVVPETVTAVSPGLTVRLLGSTRIETAVALSRATFTRAGTVVLARADEYADALVAGPLAASLDAPLLLTDRDRLHPVVAEEVRRLDVRRAVLVGSESALSGAVEDGLRAVGVTTIERVGGDDRFEVGAAVAARLASSHAYVVEGMNADPNRGWPDAVAVSALAAHHQRPIMLVTRDAVPPETLTALRRGSIRSVTVIGGPAAVSDAVLAQLRDAGISVTRIAGDTRYDTSVAVAHRGVQEGLSPARTALVTGRAWPDALAAGPAVAARGGTVVLVDGHDLGTSPATVGWLEGHAGSFERVTLVGGSAAITPPVAVGVEVVGAG